MTLEPSLRSIAAALLHAALKIAPPYAVEWGRAMLGELHHVEGDWAAFTWAAGGAGLLAKHALLSLVIPGQSNEIVPSATKENPMRKSTLIAAAACLAACLVFFAVPAFRQAFQISLAQGHSLISSVRGYYGHSRQYEELGNWLDAGTRRVAEQAMRSHDAEGLAFAALHPWQGTPDSVGLAEEAVRLDPKLTWIYAVVGHHNGSRPESDEWIAKLEQFDPDNALPHLLSAQRAAGGRYFGTEISIPAWQSAMAAAFASPKLDNYSDRLKELDYKVALRYAIDDPYEAGNEFFLDAFSGNMFFAGRPDDYVKLLLDSGDALAARGDHQSAAKQYFLAAHFGEMMRPNQQQGAEALFQRFFPNTILQGPYHRLAILYEKQGDKQQAELFSYLAARADQELRDVPALAWQLLAEGDETARRNAQILNISGIAMFFCASVVLLCAVIKVARSRSIQLSKLHAGRVTTVLGCGGVIGLLLSTTTLYLSYRPYAENLHAYLRDGDTSRLRTLGVFFNYLDYSSFYYLPSYMVYFWTGIIGLCAIALAFTTVKFMSRYRRPVLAA
jgi:hypothetical protein